MPKEQIYNEYDQQSSEEEDPIVDEDTCSSFEIESAFTEKYKIADQIAVSQQKPYVLHLCSDKSFGRIAVGLSSKNVKIFDINSNKLASYSIIENIQPQSDESSVCGVKFLDETPNNLLVGNTYGVVILYDLRTGQPEHSYKDPSNETVNTILSFDVNANGRVICSGTDRIKSEVYLQFFDVRQKTLMGGYFESHQDDVTDVKFHPTNPNLLCSGSVDGLINLFDISQTSEDDALLSTINTENSIRKLNWHKNVYEKDVISCITHTNDLKTYDCEEGDLIAEFERSQITDRIKRKSVSDCNLISCHNLDDGGLFLLATSNYNRGEVVRSVKLQGKKIEPLGLFHGNNQIIRDSIYDPKSNLLVTGGESGNVTVWSPISTKESIQRNTLKAKSNSKSRKSHGNDPY